MKGRAFGAGQAYVALSRVKSMEGLFIKNFNPNSIKASTLVKTEMERLATKTLPPEPALHVTSLTDHSWIKIGHLNIRSYMAKLEDIKCDLPISHVDIMCFSETFLKPHQQITNDLLPNTHTSVIFRLDRSSSTLDLNNGGIMITCAPSLLPESISVSHSALLEILGIVITPHSSLRMFVIVVYRRPQLPLATFLQHFAEYLANIPHQTIPTVIVGDFNDDLLSTSRPSRLTELMSSQGFLQLVKVPTTDSGSLLDHIYYNGSVTSTFIDVVDTYYSDHDATYLTLPTQPNHSLL